MWRKWCSAEPVALQNEQLWKFIHFNSTQYLQVKFLLREEPVMLFFVFKKKKQQYGAAGAILQDYLCLPGLKCQTNKAASSQVSHGKLVLSLAWLAGIDPAGNWSWKMRAGNYVSLPLNCLGCSPARIPVPSGDGCSRFKAARSALASTSPARGLGFIRGDSLINETSNLAQTLRCQAEINARGTWLYGRKSNNFMRRLTREEGVLAFLPDAKNKWKRSTR